MINIICDWICEFCYKPVVGNLPTSWELIWQSVICPDCIHRARTMELKQLIEIKCGEYSYMPDPRAKK